MTNLLVRGDPDNVGEVVKPGTTAAIAGLSSDFSLSADAPEADRRRKLAEWLTNPCNPLFARVVVNRVWHYHFGAGIVENPNDFGFNGGSPSHPELLDYWAVRLYSSQQNLVARLLRNRHRIKLARAAITTGMASTVGWQERD